MQRVVPWGLGSRHALPAVLALAGAFLVAACAAPGGTPTPRPQPPAPPSASPARSPAASPVATATPVPADSGPPDASPEPFDPGVDFNPDRTMPPGMVMWPASVVSATIALAAADREFKKAAADWTVGAQSQDMGLLLQAAEGMAYLADESIANAQRLVAWTDTKDVGAGLVDAYSAISTAGDAFAAALREADTSGVEAAVNGLASAMQAYGAVRPGLIDRAELALVQRRGLLVK